MAEPILMAAFGEDFVETRILSEANSVKYWLKAYATHSNAVPNKPELNINGAFDMTSSLRRGINVVQVNGNSFINFKTFDVTTDDNNANNKAFVEYANGLTSGLYIIMTHERFQSSPLIDRWFKNKWSASWPGSDFSKSFPNSAYVGVLGAAKGRILIESFYGNDGVVKEDSRAKVDTVYDNVGDVGYTGCPYRSIEDTNEYSDSTGYEYKRYPVQNESISKIADYGLSPGDAVFLVCDLYASKSLLDAGSTTRASLRWFKGTSLLSSNVSLEIPKNGADRWLRFEIFTAVPTDADGFTIVVSRYPKTSVVGDSKIKNLVFVQTSHGEQLNSVIQEFGVNGIRMNKGVEGGTTMIMELPNSKVDPSGIIPVQSFRETSD